MSALCPLASDLRAQAPAIRRFLLKALMLVALFLAADRLLGAFLRAGLDRYYGLDEPAAVLCVGHSHMVLGIDKVALEKTLGVPVAKFAVEGANTADRLEMIRYYFRRHPKSVRAVVYAVDAHTFTSAGLSSASYRLLFPFIDDPGIRAYVKRNCGSRTEYWLRVLLCAPRYNELTITLSFRGFLHKWTNFKFGQVNAERLAAQVREGRFRRIGFDPDNLRLFDDTANFVGSHEATFCLAYIPTIDIFNQAEPDKFSRSMDLLRSYAATNSSVRFLDYNREIQGRHELFYDPIHLNRPGQKVVTERLAEDLRAFLTKTTANSRTIQRK